MVMVVQFSVLDRSVGIHSLGRVRPQSVTQQHISISIRFAEVSLGTVIAKQ